MCSYACFLEPVDQAREEDRHVRAVRRRDRLAVVRAGQAAPGETPEWVVLDLGEAQAKRGALREAVVVADVVLLRSVVARASGTAGTGGKRRRAGVVAVDVVRLRVGSADRALADRNRDAHTKLHGVAIAADGLVRHLLVREADVGKAEVPAARHAPAAVGLTAGGELLVRVDGRADAEPSTHAGPGHRARPQLRIGRYGSCSAVVGNGDVGRLVLVGLVGDLDLRAAEHRRLVVDRVRDPAPESVADAARTFDRVARAGTATAQ